jgi:hypothetical protein
VTDVAADWAASGVVALTGRADGPPLVPPGRAATVARELAELVRARSGGRVSVDGPALLAERAAFTGRGRAGALSVGGSCRLLPTADGWAAVSCARPGDPLLLGALIGAPLGSDPWPAVAGWLRERPGAELAERAELLGVAAAPVRTSAPADGPAEGPPEGPAAGPAAVPADLPARPVEGRLVVDFSALWAGPLCTALLGLAGARVVTVETPDRPDGARRGDPGFYRLLHAGSRSVVLDPATPDGRAALADLVAAADVVVEASRPRALARWGLDAAAAVASGTRWISITAAGRASARIGFGDDVAAAAGLVADGGDGTPVFCGDALADPLTGLTAAALALTGPADGSGVLWDLSMTGVVAATLDGSPSRPARRAGSGWVVDAEEGAVPVALPRRRAATGTAPGSGADTAAVLAELGRPC